MKGERSASGFLTTRRPMSSTKPSAGRGLFFSFEGIDGSGKSTQAQMLVDALRASGETVVAVREPGGTPLGESIRSVLLDPGASITPRAEALLFAAARAQLVETVIDPALLAGKHVIADRYTDSTTAYQGAGRNLGPSVEAVTAFATWGRLPDRTYLVALSPSEALRRRSAREADRMELMSDGIRVRIAEAYSRIAAESSGRIMIVDGSGMPDAIGQSIELDARHLITKREG